MNRRGFLTINSQPAVNGAKSSDPTFGWGPRNGYVYQKSYLEVLVSPEYITEVIARIERDPEFTYYAVNKTGDLKTNAPSEGPNAVTWGVFPGKEIVQPTIVETVSFLAWKDEFYRLGQDWANCHASTSPARYVIGDLIDTWYLLNIVHNDFHVTSGIFPLFDGLKVEGMEKKFESGLTATNGTNGASAGASDGASKGTPNGEAPVTQKDAKEQKDEQSLLETAKAAAVEVTNGVKNLAVST